MARLYAREEARIRAILGDRVAGIEHTGSTSVPGLAAKPIIDITMIVADVIDEPAYVPDLEAAGYVLRIREHEPDWYDHRVFKGRTRTSTSTCSRPAASSSERMVGFRDWLRTHDDDRELYEATKRELVTPRLGVRPELRRREDRRRRGDHGPGRAARRPTLTTDRAGTDFRR